jgi:hypothetical protein
VSPELSELSLSQLASPSLVSLELSPSQLASLLLDELSPEHASCDVPSQLHDSCST